MTNLDPFVNDNTFNAVYNTRSISLTHQVRRYRSASPIGQNSGCGRGKETRRRGCPHYSRSLL